MSQRPLRDGQLREELPRLWQTHMTAEEALTHISFNRNIYFCSIILPSFFETSKWPASLELITYRSTTTIRKSPTSPIAFLFPVVLVVPLCAVHTLLEVSYYSLVELQKLFMNYQAASIFADIRRGHVTLVIVTGETVFIPHSISQTWRFSRASNFSLLLTDTRSSARNIYTSALTHATHTKRCDKIQEMQRDAVLISFICGHLLRLVVELLQHLWSNQTVDEVVGMNTLYPRSALSSP